MDLKSYFHEMYQGGESFIENVIIPIFGEDKYEDASEVDVLEDNPELQHMAETTGISQILRLGTIDIPLNPTDVFDVTVSDHVQMERNRVAIQLLVRRIMSTYSSAFMIFHYDDTTKWDWRFTFCSKQGNNTDVTDSKRYTFLLGPNQSCRTAAENFNKLADKNGCIELDDIIKAFDVEALSKEFFDKYVWHYNRFVEYMCNPANGMYHNFIDNSFDKSGLTEKEINDKKEKPIRDYMKTMLGRIVFLHFVQKKGWLGVPSDKEWGEGDIQFMRNLWKSSTKAQQANFLDEVLEPLYSDALDTDREEDNYLFDTKVSLPTGSIVKIPYLNGGLFERNELDEKTTKFPAKYFEDLFEFFYQYNFTIDENDPNDAEIGIDPEMLGRIFESQLEDNKDKGAFYTPKEIVQYMCHESLIAYLTTCVMKKQGKNHKPENEIRNSVRMLLDYPEETIPRMTSQQIEDFDRYIREVKICDPAIGSGAFPMGLLNELVYCRVIINAWAKDKNDKILVGDYGSLKAEIICNNIYGVDIEKGAIDIARLRFWLSIIVDLKQPHALPNLDYKFMQGNSLITTFNGHYVNLDTKNQKHYKVNDMKEEKRKLYRFKQQYYGSQGSRKHELAVEIKKSILRLVSMQIGYELRSWYEKNAIESSFDFDGQNANFSDIKHLLPQDKKDLVHHAETLYKQLNDNNVDIAKRALIDIDFFDWKIMFTEIFDAENNSSGFDIVIGNPPYVESRSSCIDEDQKNAIQQQLRLRLTKDNADCFPRGADLLIFFFELSFNIASSTGINVFITENSWLSTDYGCKFQKFILHNINTLAIIDSDYKYFENADINTVITFFENKGFRTVDSIPFVHCHGDLSVHPYNIQDSLTKDKTITVNSFAVTNDILSNHKWGFLFSIDNRLLQLLENMSRKEDKIFRNKIDIGQGLNLTKDCILTHHFSNSSPYYISDNGPLYRWTDSNYYVYKSNVSSTRRKPLLILPRGLGTHFCCMNEVEGYSASYVEIYEKSILTENEKLCLWTFCNSSLCWLLRELTGRCNLGGGMLKAEATDLKRIPLCFLFTDLDEIKKAFSLAKNVKVPTNIDSAVVSEIHDIIDRVVYKYLAML